MLLNTQRSNMQDYSNISLLNKTSERKWIAIMYLQDIALFIKHITFLDSPNSN